LKEVRSTSNLLTPLRGVKGDESGVT